MNMRCRCGLRAVVCSAVAAIGALAAGAEEPAPAVRPLPQAHAHNDYRHPRPLLDALDHGFRSVEADVYLVGGELLVGHDREELKAGRALETLYLAPLRERVERNGGAVYPKGPTVILLIDVKDDAEATYAALHRLLSKYEDMLTSVRGGRLEQKAVTAVVSGNRAEGAIREQEVRFAAIDGRPADLEKDEPSHVMPLVSANWTTLFEWRGDGPMSEAERMKLRGYVAKAHDRGRLVRFWATPESEEVWQELLAAKVDLIGTDDLDRLRDFLAMQE